MASAPTTRSKKQSSREATSVSFSRANLGSPTKNVGRSPGRRPPTARHTPQRLPPLPTIAARTPTDSAGTNANNVPAVGTPPKQPEEVPPMASPPRKNLPNFERLEARFADGYDSDGNGPPPPACDDVEFEEESAVPIDHPAPVVQVVDEEVVIDKTPRHIPIPGEDVEKMTVSALKHELQIRGVQFKSTGMKKGDFVQRLKAALAAELVVTIFMNEAELKEYLKNSKKESTIPKVDDLSGFAPGCYWESLKPEAASVEEPANAIPNPRAPTVPLDEAEEVPVKHNFSERFDRPVFAGRKYVPKRHPNGRQCTGLKGQLVYVPAIRMNQQVRTEFLRKHHLSSASDPVEFADAFIPWHENQYNARFFSMDQATMYSNLKAQLSNAGAGGTNYKDFKAFTCKEIRQFLGLYIFNGLSPSPRMEMKFKSQQHDPVQGNDFINQHIGINLERRWRHFKAFFALQDPRKDTPPRKAQPLHKVHRLVNWINFIGPKAVQLGEHASVDEQTIGFQGRHGDKMRITFKRAGDGFQCDVLCEDGFTFTVYFRNVPAPEKYTRQGLSPLHARVMYLFDSLEDTHHRVWMDNLYLSATFCKAAYNHPMKVMIAGVTRKGGRGLPISVLQQEVDNKKDQMKVRGTVKVSVLQGDPMCPALVAASVYDTKPVHFLSMICESIKWIAKERSVFNVDTNKCETLRFLRLNINDSYNGDMGHVDVSDQLREVHKFNQWMRNYKRWWAIMQWGIGVLLVNAFVVYKLVCEADGVTPLTHYEFRKTIALSWIDKGEVTIAERRRLRTRQADTVQTPQIRTEKRHPSSSATTRKTMSGSSNNRKRRAFTPPSAELARPQKMGKSNHLTDASVDSTTGPFGRRLDRFVGHWPQKPEKQQCCALHRCCIKMDVRKDVVTCSCCQVNLCLDCFQLFHTLENLADRKENIAKRMAEMNEDTTKPTKK